MLKSQKLRIIKCFEIFEKTVYQMIALKFCQENFHLIVPKYKIILFRMPI